MPDWSPFYDRAWHPRHLGQGGGQWRPQVELYRKRNQLVLRVDLPGMKKADVEVFLDDGDLVLRGERREIHHVREFNYFCSECHYGRFMRRLRLPVEVKAKKVRAKLRDGVLEVRLPLRRDRP